MYSYSMKYNTYFALFVFFILLVISACSSTQSTDRRALIGSSINNYQSTMACVTPVYRYAPTLCAPPPSGPRMSRADSDSPHGKKLYHLYVSDEEAYIHTAAGNQEAPVGLVLVKEAHSAQAVTPIDNAYSAVGGMPAHTAGEISELFIMSKVGNKNTPNTDAGWVYSVANPQGEVIFSGLIDSCISCHKESPNDRLFGLAPATTSYLQPSVFDED